MPQYIRDRNGKLIATVQTAQEQGESYAFACAVLPFTFLGIFLLVGGFALWGSLNQMEFWGHVIQVVLVLVSVCIAGAIYGKYFAD